MNTKEFHIQYQYRSNLSSGNNSNHTLTASPIPNNQTIPKSESTNKQTVISSTVRVSKEKLDDLIKSQKKLPKSKGVKPPVTPQSVTKGAILKENNKASYDWGLVDRVI